MGLGRPFTPSSLSISPWATVGNTFGSRWGIRTRVSVTITFSPAVSPLGPDVTKTVCSSGLEPLADVKP
jgi:hypothetical protein